MMRYDPMILCLVLWNTELFDGTECVYGEITYIFDCHQDLFDCSKLEANTEGGPPHVPLKAIAAIRHNITYHFGHSCRLSLKLSHHDLFPRHLVATEEQECLDVGHMSFWNLIHASHVI